MEPKQTLPQRLRCARESRRFTQVTLAKRAGVHPATMSHFEAGRRAPSLKSLLRLAEALNVTTDYLLGCPVASAATGPDVGRLLRHVARLSSGDVDMLADFAELFVQRRQNSGAAEQDDTDETQHERYRQEHEAIDCVVTPSRRVSS